MKALKKLPTTDEVEASVRALMNGQSEGAWHVERDDIRKMMIILDYVMYIIIGVRHYTLVKNELLDFTFFVAITGIDP